GQGPQKGIAHGQASRDASESGRWTFRPSRKPVMRIQRREMGCLKLGHFATEPRTHAEFRELPDRVEPSSRRKESGAKHARMVKRKRLKQEIGRASCRERV